MKPRKTTAPSNSQRDSQDLNWKKEFDQNFVGAETHFSDWLTNENGHKIKDFIQQQKDKAHQAGFQEAVELVSREFDYAILELPNDNSVVVYVQKFRKFLRSLKPTPDQGSEGEGK